MLSGLGPTHVIQCWMSDTSVRLLCCLRSKLYRKHNTETNSTSRHSRPHLHLVTHSATFCCTTAPDRPPLATPTPLARPLHRTLSIKSLPEDTHLAHNARTRQARTHTITHASQFSRRHTSSLHTSATPASARSASLVVFGPHHPSPLVPSSESQHPPPELTPCKAPRRTDSWRGDSPALVTIPPSYPHRFHPPSGSSEMADRLSYTSQTHQIRHPLHSCR